MFRQLACFVAAAAMLTPNARAAGTLEVVNAWSRPATGTGVVYATIVNHGTRPDRLVGGSSPLATRLELHETTSTKASGHMAAMGNMSMPGGTITMLPVSYMTVPAGGEAVLAPGGYHIMLIDLRRDLKAGEVVPLRLHFAAAGWLGASARVRPF